MSHSQPLHAPGVPPGTAAPQSGRLRLALANRPLAFLLLWVLAGCLTGSAGAQTPPVLWWTSVGAQVFATDAQTNVYANAGGTIVQVSGAGVPLQTNSLNPLASFAARDTAGNWYLAGTYPGVPFSGGYNYANPACFLTKYAPDGTLLWERQFGPQGWVRLVTVGDLQLEPASGTAYVGYTYVVTTLAHSSEVARFDAAGVMAWTATPPKSSWMTTAGSVRLGAVSTTNAFAVTFVNSSYATLSRLDDNGAATSLATWMPDNWLDRPCANSLGELYNVEIGTLTKRSATGALIWRSTVPAGAFPIASDHFDGVHVAGTNGWVARFDSDGNQVWAITNLAAPAQAMVLDKQGNRFLSLQNGELARLGDEILALPGISQAPADQTALAGSNVVLTVGATGTTPLRYFWLFNGTPLPAATQPSLNLTQVTPAQAGTYSVIVSNFLGSVTSAPALVRVKSVAIFCGDQLLTNGTYVFSNPPAFNIRSAFPNGLSFYTLDGSAPSFASTAYSQPFTLSQSATIRALAYSSDFLQAEEADPVQAVILKRHKLTVVPTGGGTVGAFPNGCSSPPPGLVACWRGENNTLDSIGTNHGLVQGSLSYGPGMVGQGFALGGQGGIMVPASPSLDVGQSNGMSIELWFKINPGTDGGYVLQWNASSGGSIFIYGYAGLGVSSDGTLWAGFTVNQTLHEMHTAASLFAADGNFHHLGFTYDKSTGLATLYLDGQQAGQSNLGLFTPRTSDNVYIGKLNGSTYYSAGVLDEISLYGRVLSAPEMQAIYQAGSQGKCVPVPVEGTYLSTDSVSFSAIPAPGYSFLYWRGDASGTDSSITLSMEQDRFVEPVFGTTLATTVAGNGQVLLDPPGGLYPYGATVRLTAVPQPGNYFGLWGNAASGNLNPLYLALTNPNPTVSAIFGAVPAGQSALTLLVNGAGHVEPSPRANAYATGQNVTLTAVPDPGQQFLGWSGDAGGSANPLSLNMDQAKVITATFSSRPALRISQPGIEGMTPEGFRFTISGGDAQAYEVFASTNLNSWQSLGVWTNTLGEILFTDPAAGSSPSRFYRVAPPQ